MVDAMTTPDDSPLSATETTMRNVRDYVVRCGRGPTELAREIGLDEKSVRQVRDANWNPRATTLRKLEALLPEGWTAGDPLPMPPEEAAA